MIGRLQHIAILGTLGFAAAVLVGLVTPAAAAPYAVPKGVGKWAREKGYYKTVREQRLPFARFMTTRLADGTMVVIYGRGYIERQPGSHLWTQHLPPRHSGNLWLWQCVGGSRRHMFFIAKAGPKWASTWLCSVRPKGRAKMLLPLHGYGNSAAFVDGQTGAFAVGSHLVTTVDGGEHWVPQPKLVYCPVFNLTYKTRCGMLASWRINLRQRYRVVKNRDGNWSGWSPVGPRPRRSRFGQGPLHAPRNG